MFHLPSASWFTPDLKQIWEGFPYLIFWVEVGKGSGTWPKKTKWYKTIQNKQSYLHKHKCLELICVATMWSLLIKKHRMVSWNHVIQQTPLKYSRSIDLIDVNVRPRNICLSLSTTKSTVKVARFPTLPHPPPLNARSQELLDGSQGAKGIVIGFAQFSSYKNLLPGNASGRAC